MEGVEAGLGGDLWDISLACLSHRDKEIFDTVLDLTCIHIYMYSLVLIHYKLQ